MNAPGRCDVHPITQVIASRSYSSPERQLSKKVLRRPPVGPHIDGLQTQGDAIIGESEFGVTEPWRAAEITRRIDPHGVEHPQRTFRCSAAHKTFGRVRR